MQRHRSGGTPPRLYDTGERMQGINQNAKLEDNLARFIGVPVPRSYDVDGISKRQQSGG